MSWIRSFGGELRRGLAEAQPFFSGRGLERVGKLAAGSAMASANFAARAAHLGLGSGARVMRSAASRVEGFVPGAGLTRRLAETVDHEAAAAARAAAGRLAESLELIAQGSSREPRGAPTRRAAWSELAADTALAPLSSLVGSSLRIGVESIREVASSRPGQLALDAGLERLSSAADAGPFRFETALQRQSFVVVTTDSGAGAIRTTYAFAEAMARLAFSDTRQMRQALEEGLREMRHLADSSQMQDLLPTPMISEALQERARLIVDRAPRRFLQALADAPDGQPPGLGAILRAAVDDAEGLRVFVTVYPQVLTMVGTDVGKLLFAGAITFTEMEAFFEGRRYGDEAR